MQASSSASGVVGRHLAQLGEDAGLRAGLDLVAHVDLRGRIVADQDDGDARLHAVLLLQALDTHGVLGAQFARHRLAVNDPRGHQYR